MSVYCVNTFFADYTQRKFCLQPVQRAIEGDLFREFVYQGFGPKKKFSIH